MILILLFACSAHDASLGFLYVVSDSVDLKTDSAPQETDSYEEIPIVYWGDLHSHSNLSQDGCEDPLHECLPLAGTPSKKVFAQAAVNGLRFMAITEHAEFNIWFNRETQEQVNIWQETQDLANEALGGPVIPIIGYEWTSIAQDDYGGSHRTVLLEEAQPCASLRIAGVEGTNPKGGLKHELYLNQTAYQVHNPQTLQAALEMAMEQPDCMPTRIVSYFHHPAFSPPQSTNWAHPYNHVGDTVVEILSEHGSSECADSTQAGCDWHIREGYVPTGSVQTALQLGYKLGFVGGTDNHEANPGSVTNGPGPIAHLHDTNQDGILDVQWQSFSGGLTGVWQAESKADIFDALWARQTLAASWPFARVGIKAVSDDGTIYLPGADIPAGHYTLEIALPGYAYIAELLSPTGEVQMATEMEIASGDIRYIRIRADVNGIEQRIFASPFFAI